MSNAKKVEFKNRKKDPHKKEIGREYTDFLVESLEQTIKDKIDNFLVFSENSPVDFVCDELALGMECKRFVTSEFGNMGHAKGLVAKQRCR